MPDQQQLSVRRFQLLLLVGALFVFILQWINGRDGMADYRVYRDAAEAWMGGGSPYGTPFFVDTGFYKYAPIMLVPFMAVVGLPIKVGASLFYWAIVGAMVWLIPRVNVRSREYWPSNNPMWFALVMLTLVMGDHLFHELHLGNTNLLLLALAWSVFRHTTRQKWGWAGVAYAIMLLAKPHFLILLPWFVLRAEWRVLGVSAAGLVIGLFLPCLAVGWSGNAFLLNEWALSISEHQSMLPSANTWASMLGGIAGFELPAPTWLFVLTLGAAASGVLLLVKSNGFGKVGEREGYTEYFLLVALIPNLANTDTEHFLWSIPVLAGVLALLPLKRGFAVYWVLLLVLALPWLLSSPDFIGRPAAEWLDKSGLIGLSNTLLLLVFVVLVLMNRRGRIADPRPVVD